MSRISEIEQEVTNLVFIAEGLRYEHQRSVRCDILLKVRNLQHERFGIEVGLCHGVVCTGCKDLQGIKTTYAVILFCNRYGKTVNEVKRKTGELK